MGDMKRFDAIQRLSKTFRNSIDNLYNEGVFKDSPAMRNFPAGSCGYVSEMLGEYLKRNGIEMLYVTGVHKDQSHAWLVDEASNGLIVDITGDQFRDNPEYAFYDKSVYVGLVDEVHSVFDIRSHMDVGLGKDPQQYVDYVRIVERINLP